jgi:hypothetical protein
MEMDRMEMEWRRNGEGMEKEWRWNGEGMEMVVTCLSAEKIIAYP